MMLETYDIQKEKKDDSLFVIFLAFTISFITNCFFIIKNNESFHYIFLIISLIFASILGIKLGDSIKVHNPNNSIIINLKRKK